MVFSQEVRSRWTDTPLKIDGDNSDWIKNPKYWDSDSKVLYEARNDSENLYLIFAMTDKISQMKFMQAGFQIYIKVKSKPKLKASIDFLPQRIIRGKSVFDTAQIKNEMIQTYLLRTNHAEINGFLKTSENINRSKNSNENFTFDIGLAENSDMLVEIQIPLSEIFASPISLKKLKQIPIDSKFTINALEHKGVEKMQSKGGGRQGGNNQGGRQGGGRKPSGDSIDKLEKMEDMISEQSFKMKFYLRSK